MKNVYTPPFKSASVNEFADMKRSAELVLTRYRLAIYVLLVIVFASKGAWMMYYSITIGSILIGMFLAFLSAACGFMAVCEIMDLTDGSSGG